MHHQVISGPHSLFTFLDAIVSPCQPVGQSLSRFRFRYSYRISELVFVKITTKKTGLVKNWLNPPLVLSVIFDAFPNRQKQEKERPVPNSIPFDQKSRLASSEFCCNAAQIQVCS